MDGGRRAADAFQIRRDRILSDGLNKLKAQPTDRIFVFTTLRIGAALADRRLSRNGVPGVVQRIVRLINFFPLSIPAFTNAAAFFLFD